METRHRIEQEYSAGEQECPERRPSETMRHQSAGEEQTARDVHAVPETSSTVPVSSKTPAALEHLLNPVQHTHQLSSSPAGMDNTVPSTLDQSESVDPFTGQVSPPGIAPTHSQSAPTDSDSVSTHAPSSFSIGLSVDTDDSRSDADSALGSFRTQSSSMSATSSIFDFVEEHGRTWHRYHEGKYFMPNDIPEQERLDLQHSIAVRLFEGLYLAPVERPNRVLDIGTGTGIWAIDFANEHPESDVLGTDLSPIQPEYVPPNCRFEVDDAEDEWVYSEKFDFIHSRHMTGSISDFPAMFAKCYENLNPGGWIEFQDYYVKLQCVDDSLAGTALERWNDLMIDAVKRMGKNACACAKYKSQMTDAGFVDVTEKKFALPGNQWAKGDDQKMLGAMQLENIMDGLHGFSIGLFTKMLGWAPEEVELLLVDVRKDLRNTKIHFYYIV
ncbi:hypothetical protein N0V93_008179 [Gnomoniopsis smithogilvyi]|uniref:Methyltransferase n=1 Tax=Gnomoniopsis smithogilvyi TaxID=1191159 RepID=A0A9W8YMH3_9PEZI|nr:hypothetical protein N0V93_008179 [Gnomoniopsis smithogilvyi]